MRRLILEEWISLDGFAADKNGQLDFFPSAEANRYSDKDQLQFLEQVDTILLGRVTYELFADFWPSATTETEIIADKLNSLPKLVCSNTLTKAPWGRWPNAQIIRGNAIEAIKELKKGEGKHIVLWGSLSLAQSLMKEKLIDEYHIQVCPVLLGAGRPLFTHASTQAGLRLLNVRNYDTGVVHLQYEL
jgi:dihydrofolate reductase